MLQMWVPIVPEHVWSKVSPKDAANKFQNSAADASAPAPSR